MLRKTKCVLGKAGMNQRFRRELFTAGMAPTRLDRRVEVLHVLENHELYVSGDELEEIVTMVEPLSPTRVDEVTECLANQPLGGRLTALMSGTDPLAALIAALAGPEGPPLIGALEIVQCLVCQGPEPTIEPNRFVPREPLRCKQYPCV